MITWQRGWAWVLRRVVGMAVAVSAAPVGATEPERALTLDEVLASAEHAHPSWRAAALERDLADSELTTARGAFDLTMKARVTLTPLGYYDSVRAEATLEKPTALWGLSTFAGYKLGTGEFPLYDQRQQTLAHGELRAGANLPLWRNGPIDRRRANVSRAELGQQIADLSAAQQRIELRRAATHRYWAWVAAGQRLLIARTLLDNVLERDAALAVRITSGDLPPIDRVENARAIEQRRAQAAQAQRSLEQAAIELGLFLRDERGRPLSPPAARLPAAFGDDPPGEAVELLSDLASARAQRPEPRRLELAQRQQRLELDLSNNQLAPAIDLQLAASRDFGPALATRPDLNEPVLEASLALDIPLEQRLLRGRVDGARAALERLGLQLQLARERIDVDVSDAHSALRAARERIEASRREVALAHELEVAERVRYDQGESNLLIVNLREQQTAEAELRQIDARLEQCRALADLHAARAE